MIKLSIEEVKNYKKENIDFDLEEQKVRTRNIQILRNVILILKDESFLKTDNSIIVKLMQLLNTNDLNVVIKEIENTKIVINNFALKFNLSYEKVLCDISNNETAFMCFVKSPSKQTFHQKVQTSYLKSIPFFDEVIQLSPSGKESLFIDNGKIINNSKNFKKTKSIDVLIKYRFKNKAFNIYGTQKYTKEKGGSQDNQYRDVLNFHQEAKSCIDSDIFFISITDGAYYNTPETSFKEKINDKYLTKLEYLNYVFKGERNLATTSNNICKDLIPVIKAWLIQNFTSEEIKEELEKFDMLETFF